MIGSFVIVFREVLEAALVIGVVAAAVDGLPNRGRWVALGISLGVAGAVGVAAGIGKLSSLAQGAGQEIFSAGVLFTAGLLLAWHNIWMAEHGRKMTARLEALGTDVLVGKASLIVLVGVTALAVLREGSEIALFLYSIAAGGARGLQLLGGGLLGLAGGAAAGVLMFVGLSQVPVKQLFRISGVIILFIAAGMFAKGAQFLVQAGLLSPLISPIWDSSALVSGNGLLGRSLAALVGYTPEPSLLELLFWAASVAAIGGLMFATSRRVRAPRGHAAAAALVTLCASAAFFGSWPVHADDYQVYSPRIVRGETEIESRAFRSRGTNEQSGAEAGFKFAIGRAFRDRWATELYAEAEREYDETLKLEELEWENVFQLTATGEHWLDVGLLNENKIPRFADDPYEIGFGPIFAKDFGRWTALLNLLAVHEYGTNAESGVGFEYRAHVEYRWRRSLSPAIEAYGMPASQPGGQRRHQLGPVIGGQIQLAPGRSLRYGAAALFGVSDTAPDRTLVLRIEYEYH